MGVNYVVLAVRSEDFIFGADIFVHEAQKRWPGCEVFDANRSKDSQTTLVQMKPQDEPPFSIDHFPNNRMVSTDGTPDQAAEVAAWVRQANSDPGLVLWFVDDSFSGHTVLYPGITPEQVAANWVDHSEHDPYTEYPDYFK